MPHTVPKRPTNGAVEPTVARNSRPSWVRLCTLEIARSIDKVAGPVGEALIRTAIGLAVAVPAVLGYNWLIRRNKAAMERVRAFGADLHAVLLSAKPASRG